MDYIKDLIEIVGEKNVKTDRIERLCYSRDMSVHEGIPDAIVFARTTEVISKSFPGAPGQARPGRSSPVLAVSSSM
jgi:hypothetical protein